MFFHLHSDSTSIHRGLGCQVTRLHRGGDFDSHFPNSSDLHALFFLYWRYDVQSSLLIDHQRLEAVAIDANRPALIPRKTCSRGSGLTAFEATTKSSTKIHGVLLSASSSI
ncbi:hypothetical protein QYF36_006458 [Acer negundo]|nr:hypothetical protein QYF36_006458 [Acer negundo]